jgi:hypothetical protein
MQNTDVNGTRLYGVTLKSLPWRAHISCPFTFPPNDGHVVWTTKQFSVMDAFVV